MSVKMWGGAALGTATLLLAGQNMILAEDQPAPAVAATENQTAAEEPALNSYSGGVTEVLKLLDAKVSSDVIQAFIKTSPAPFDLSAEQLVALKAKGVPDDLLTTMMQRGDELRKTAQAPVASPADTAPGYTVAPPETADSYPYYGYPPYGGYPYDYGYWWGYPGWSGVVVSSGFGHSHFHNGAFHHDGFHHGNFMRQHFPNGQGVHSPLGSPPMLHSFSGMGVGSSPLGSPPMLHSFGGTPGSVGSFGGRSSPLGTFGSGTGSGMGMGGHGSGAGHR